VHAKTTEPIEMPFGLWTRVGMYQMSVQMHEEKAQFLGERTCPGMPDDTLL